MDQRLGVEAAPEGLPQGAEQARLGAAGVGRNSGEEFFRFFVPMHTNSRVGELRTHIMRTMRMTSPDYVRLLVYQTVVSYDGRMLWQVGIVSDGAVVSAQGVMMNVGVSGDPQVLVAEDGLTMEEDDVGRHGDMGESGGNDDCQSVYSLQL